SREPARQRARQRILAVPQGRDGPALRPLSPIANARVSGVRSRRVGGTMRFFFMHLGTLVGIITYFQVLERGHYTPEAVRSAAVIGLLVHGTYMAIARWRGYLKQFDIGVTLLFAVAAISAFAGIGPVVSLFKRYSPALLFATLTLTALIPLLLGRETFTYFYGRRNSPPWQQKLALFDSINRLMTVF